MRQPRLRVSITPAPAAAPATAATAAAEAEGGALALLLDDARVLQRRRDVEHLGHLVDRLGEADALFGAADAGVAAADRPVVLAGIAEAQGGAVGVGFRALAAELVEAVALAVAASPNSMAKRPASKWARRSQFSWIRRE
jgi:2-keto-3-deoxy-galactonokinase